MEDEEVRRLLRERFGTEIFSANGDLNRAALRAIVFADSEKKRALEQILHPRIRQQWSTAAEESRQSGQLFLADIPLLYETQGEFLCDRVVVVACSQEIQQQRLISRTHLTPSAALAMIDSQMPLSEKISRADHVVWNNGPVAVLEAQARILARSLALIPMDDPTFTAPGNGSASATWRPNLTSRRLTCSICPRSRI